MIFFFYGEDNYSSNEKLKQIKEKFIRDVDVSGYNIVILDEKLNIEKLSKELSQGGFLVSKKLVIIKNLLQGQISKDLASFVIDYLQKSENKNDDSNIIVFYENQDLNSKKSPLTGEKLRIFNKLHSLKYSQEFKKMNNKELVKWIQGKFKEDGKSIDMKLSDILIAKSGSDLWTLENEINKISNYNQEEKINEKSIHELASSFINDDIFLFCEKISEKKKSEALRLLNDQIRLGVNPIYILSMITRQFKILLQIKSAIENKISINNLPKYLSIHQYVIKKSMPIATQYSIQELKTIYKKLLKLDEGLKSSKLDQAVLISLFALDV